jgi:biotin carboxyl carrier protein
MNNQAQFQKQVTTQAIAQTNSAPANKQTAIESIPSNAPVDASNAIPAMINSPTVGAILALAVLVRVIVDRPSSDKK